MGMCGILNCGRRLDSNQCRDMNMTYVNCGKLIELRYSSGSLTRRSKHWY
jgi:hypothetical protein